LQSATESAIYLLRSPVALRSSVASQVHGNSA
jgi:hypothetical protein